MCEAIGSSVRRKAFLFQRMMQPNKLKSVGTDSQKISTSKLLVPDVLGYSESN